MADITCPVRGTGASLPSGFRSIHISLGQAIIVNPPDKDREEPNGIKGGFFHMAPRFKGFILILALSMAFTFCGAKNGDPVAGAEKPKVVHVGPVAPDIMGITITSGRVEYGRQVTYTKEYTGKLTPDGAGNMWIRQWGKITGAMVGDGTKIITLDQGGG